MSIICAGVKGVVLRALEPPPGRRLKSFHVNVALEGADMRFEAQARGTHYYSSLWQQTKNIYILYSTNIQLGLGVEQHLAEVDEGTERSTPRVTRQKKNPGKNRDQYTAGCVTVTRTKSRSMRLHTRFIA